MKQKWNETIFEHGKWIRNKNGDKLKVKKYDKKLELIITYPSGLSNTGHFLEECIAWKPRKKEWCWFYRDNHIPMIARYSRKQGRYYIGYVEFKNGTRVMVHSEKIEPFIGIVPEYLKGRKCIHTHTMSLMT